MAEQCCAPIRDQITDPLRMKPMFEITCDRIRDIVTRCLVESHPKHGQQNLKVWIEDRICCINSNFFAAY